MPGSVRGNNIRGQGAPAANRRNREFPLKELSSRCTGTRFLGGRDAEEVLLHRTPDVGNVEAP